MSEEAKRAVDKLLETGEDLDWTPDPSDPDDSTASLNTPPLVKRLLNYLRNYYHLDASDTLNYSTEANGTFSIELRTNKPVNFGGTIYSAVHKWADTQNHDWHQRYFQSHGLSADWMLDKDMLNWLMATGPSRPRA